MSGSAGHRGWGRYFAGAAALMAALALGGCTLFTPSRAEVPREQTLTKLTTPSISTKGVLTIGIAANDAPQVATDADGQLAGYNIDVARALCKNLGLEATFVTGADPSAVGSDGEPDIYLGAVADDASDDVTLVGTFLEDAPAIFGKGGADSAASGLSAEDLSGSTVAVQMGSAPQDVLSACGIDAERKTYGNVNECFQALDAGEVDYVVCEASAGSYLARAYEGVGLLGTIDEAVSYGIAVRTTNTELAEKIEEALNELSSDGTLDAIHIAWYGSNPLSLSDRMISGITTSAERAAAEKAAEDAEDDEDAADGSDDGADADGDADDADSASEDDGSSADEPAGDLATGDGTSDDDVSATY